MKSQFRTAALLVLTLGSMGTALAAAAVAVPESLRACARKQDVLQRLSCYDAEMAKLESQPAAGGPAKSAATPAATATTPAAPVAAATPSLGSEQLRRGPGAGKVDKNDPDSSLTGRIEALRTTTGGLAVVTLDNGQVWRQLEIDAYYPLAVGDTVRVDKGALGSYKLTLIKEGWKRWIRVVRVQ